jgi:hypothetical protein
MQFYKINFGYTQVLFMGSVPRINRLLVIVPLLTYSSFLTYLEIINKEKKKINDSKSKVKY